MQGGYGLDILRVHRDGRGGRRARRRRTRCCAASATGSSTGRTGSGRGSKRPTNYTQQPLRHPRRLRARRAGAARRPGSCAGGTAAFFVGLLLVGVVIAVGAHPYDSPTPLGRVFKAFATSSTAGLALRSTGVRCPSSCSRSRCCSARGQRRVRRVRARRRAGAGAPERVAVVVVLIVAELPRARRRHVLRRRTCSAPRTSRVLERAAAALSTRATTTPGCSSCPAPTSRRTAGATRSTRSRPGSWTGPTSRAS